MPALLLARQRSLAGYSRNFVVNVARFFWITLVFLREVGSFFWSISDCSWPDALLTASGEEPVHILLVADTQARLEPFGSGPLGLQMYDSFLRRAWHVATRLRPHMVIFLGDMLSPGVTVARERYQEYVAKHRALFYTDTRVLYVPGNNDVGLGQPAGVLRQLRHSYSENFGETNQAISVKNHTLVLLDSPGVVEEDYARAAQNAEYAQWSPLSGGAVEFTRGLAQDEPLLLFSHIPMFRPDSASCGPLREKGGIRRGAGPGYQNTLGKQTTTFLLRDMRPAAVFSADNRDYCDFTHYVAHDSTVPSVREVTVKSFSQARHIRHPGFQLLSITKPMDLVPANEQRSFVDRSCNLPNTNLSYTTVYWSFGILTFIALYYVNRQRARRAGFAPSSLSSSPRRLLRSPTRSPLLQPQPDSAIWSPYTPITTSPKGSFPTSLRTPNVYSNSTPTLQAFARPTSPKGTPLLTPVRFPLEDEDASMYPAQYTNYYPDSSFHDDEHEGAHSAHFLPHPSPPLIPTSTNPPGWFWTFVFRGRLRRVYIPRPDISRASVRALLQDLIALRSFSRGSVSNSPWQATLVDTVAVLWPAMCIWFSVIFWAF